MDIAAPSNPDSRPIEKLPEDILLHIFRHCVEMGDTVRAPALTCRNWYRVVEANPSLRGRIQFSSTGDLEIHNREPDQVCKTPSQLTRAIGRVKDALFTLSFSNHIGWKQSPSDPWSDVPWDRFANQCVRLSIIADHHADPVLVHFPKLYRLRCFEDGMKFGDVPFLSHILSSNPELHLDHISMYAPAFDASEYPEVAAQLKTCKIEYLPWRGVDRYKRLLSAFRDLEEMEWTQQNPPPEDFEESVSWNFSLKSLKGPGIIPSVFPHRLLCGLSELRVDSEMRPLQDYYSAKPSITLPLLTRLFLTGSWIELIQIRAPALQSLTLRYATKPLVRGSMAYLLKTSLRPSSLDITDEGDGETLTAFLRGPFKDVINLRMNVKQAWVHKKDFLGLIAGTEEEPPICPRMKHLVKRK
ncbi:hypothetical protein FRC17_000161 [Serendipita sp. 399]|nr:hypothetical protein FRC17_000161 [Serendipita sp. 399]